MAKTGLPPTFTSVQGTKMSVKQRYPRAKAKWKSTAPSHHGVLAETSERAKRSAAAKARLVEGMAATKLYEAYQRHPLASRVMTFRDFKNRRKRDQILNGFTQYAKQ